MDTFTACPVCADDATGRTKCPNCWAPVETASLDPRSPDRVLTPWVSPLDRRVDARLRQLLNDMREARAAEILRGSAS